VSATLPDFGRGCAMSVAMEKYPLVAS
jgi:hypothetical protein